MYPLDSAQSKQVQDSILVFEALRDAHQKYRDYRGGMHWKTINGRKYLYKTLDRRGNARSLGPESPETVEMEVQFKRRKEALKERIKALQAQMDRHERVNRALRVGSVPSEVASICRQLDESDLMGKAVMIIGTNAMHAYEAMAGVRFKSDLMATIDVDVLWNHKSKLSLAASEQVDVGGLMGLLKRADRSFEKMANQPFRAVSSKGFMVDLIRQMPNPPWADEPDRFFEDDDLVATDIWNMNWMLGAPQVKVPVIAMDGSVAMMAAPDPRAFVMFKLWLSEAPDREPIKKQRDLEQATEVISLIQDYLDPRLIENWPSLKSFPEEVVQKTMSMVERQR
jgi:hypothetical protein